MQVTCRICGMKCAANEDAVLLCSECRREPDTMRVRVESVFEATADNAGDRLIALSVEDLKRYQALLKQRIAAKKAGGVELSAFTRRYEKTLAIGDHLARYLEAQDAADRTAKWKREALAELDALVSEELFI